MIHVSPEKRKYKQVYKNLFYNEDFELLIELIPHKSIIWLFQLKHSFHPLKIISNSIKVKSQ